MHELTIVLLDSIIGTRKRMLPLFRQEQEREKNICIIEIDSLTQSKIALQNSGTPSEQSSVDAVIAQATEQSVQCPHIYHTTYPAGYLTCPLCNEAL